MTGDQDDLLDRLQKAMPPWFEDVLLAASPIPPPPPPREGTLDWSEGDNTDLLAALG